MVTVSVKSSEHEVASEGVDESAGTEVEGMAEDVDAGSASVLTSIAESIGGVCWTSEFENEDEGMGGWVAGVDCEGSSGSSGVIVVSRHVANEGVDVLWSC